MKRIIFALLITAALLPASRAVARVGETEAQVEARYGKPYARDVQRGSLRLFAYRKDDMEIGVIYQDGKSAAELYSKRDKSALSDTEIRVLLDANSAGASWVKAPGGVPMWKIESLAYVATYDGHTLSICTQRFLDTTATERKDSEKQKLKDF